MQEVRTAASPLGRPPTGETCGGQLSVAAGGLWGLCCRQPCTWTMPGFQNTGLDHMGQGTPSRYLEFFWPIPRTRRSASREL